MNEMIKTIKEIHLNDVCLFKIGNFYHTYGKDAYILSYIFGYKLKSVGENIKECGFPINSINKIMAKLENNQINYVLIDRRNNYEVDKKEDFKNLNKYEKVLEKSRIYINQKARVENINSFLIENIGKPDFRKILGKIEDIIYEGREI